MPMGKLADKKGEIERTLSEYGNGVNVDVSDRQVVVNVQRRTTEVRGQVDKDLDGIKGAVRKEVKDVVGYDLDVMIAVDVEEL